MRIFEIDTLLIWPLVICIGYAAVCWALRRYEKRHGD